MCVSGDGIVHEVVISSFYLNCKPVEIFSYTYTKVLNGLYQAHPELSDAKEGAKGLLHTALVHIPGGAF